MSLFIALAVVSLIGCGKKETTSSNTSEPSTSVVTSTPIQESEQLKYPLKVKEVGLGKSRTPCSPSEETYVDMFQKPIRVQMECSFGEQRDETQVVFSIDGKSVVRVTRKQYLMPSDPEPEVIVKSAISFYGVPISQDDGNWLANYGEAYTISYEGKRASTSMNPNGVGLLIKGFMCADGNWGTENCGNLGTSVIKFDLVDVDGYKKQIEDGKAAQSAKQQSQISNQKF